MEDFGLNCSVCEERYSDERPPRNLGCGHCLCGECLAQVLSRDKKCPECRQIFPSNDLSSFVVSYPLLRLARNFTDVEVSMDVNLDTSIPATGPYLDAGECPGHGSRLFFRCMRCSLWVCRDCIVVNHQVPPRGPCKILTVAEALDEMKKSHKGLADAKIKVGAEARQFLEAKLKHLQAAQNQQQDAANRVRSLLAEISTNLNDLEAKKIQLIKKIADIDSLTELATQAEASVKCSESTDEFADALEDSKARLESLEQCVGDDVPDIPAMVNMSIFSNRTLVGLLDSGTSVYLTQVLGGRHRWSRISRLDDRIHLHALREGSPAEGCFVLPYEMVRQLIPRDSPSVFMDVAWGGLVQGRVYLRMFGATPRSRQTTYLCSGERGPSYRGTCFYKANKPDKSIDIIRGGDYEHNDGSGGRAIVQGITDGGVYLHEITNGLLVSRPASEERRLGSFDIYLRDCPGIYDNAAHGIVTSGLEVLRLAARQKPITNTSLMDCGLVVPVT